jgi:hypothetical protein
MVEWNFVSSVLNESIETELDSRMPKSLRLLRTHPSIFMRSSSVADES